MAPVATIAAGILLATLPVTACGGGEDPTTTGAGESGLENPLPAPNSPPPPGSEGLPFAGPALERGREAVAEQGCLACHRVGAAGLDAEAPLGPELTRIGAELDRAELRRAIVRGPSFMPSYREMPPRELGAVVDYLASLR